MVAPMVGSLGAESDRDGHLGHHCGATTANEAAVGEKYLTAAACRLDRRIHACRAGANHQNVGFGVHRFVGHDDLVEPGSCVSSIIGTVGAGCHLVPAPIMTKYAIAGYFGCKRRLILCLYQAAPMT